MRRNLKCGSVGLAAAALALGLAGCTGSSGGGDSANSTGGMTQKASGGSGAGTTADLAAPPAPSEATGAGGTAGTAGDTASGAPSGAAATGTAGVTAPRVLTAAAVQPAYQIRTASIDLTAKDPLAAKAKVVTIAQGAGGFVYADDSSTGGQDTAVTVTLKVPPDAYDSVVRRISDVAKLQRIQQQTQDVTGQVVDVQSRLAVQKASIARLRALLDNAGDLGKIIQIESELTKREADLESMEAQLKALTAKTDLATIAVSITEPGKEHKPEPATTVTVADGFGGGAHAFVTFFRWLGIAFGAVLPFAAAAAVIAAAVIVVRRKLRPSHPQEG